MLMPAEAMDAKDRLGAALGGHRRTVPHFRTGLSLSGGHCLFGLTHVAHHTPRRCALGNTACPRGTNEPQTPASFGDNSSALKQPAAGITWHRRHAAGPPRSAVSAQNVGPRLPDDGYPLRGCSTPRVSIRRSGGWRNSPTSVASRYLLAPQANF